MLLGVGAGAVATGGALGGIALGHENDLNTLNTLETRDDAVTKGKRSALIADILFGVGGAMLVTGVVLVAVSYAGKNKSRRAAVAPTLTRRGGRHRGGGAVLMRGWAIASVLALVGSTAACSLALDFLQCRNNSDCINEMGTELICRDNECIVPPDPATVACSQAAECVDALGENHVCRTDQGNCAALVSDQCPTVITPDGADPGDLVWVGAIQATSPPFDIVGVPLQNAVRLAVSDFNMVANVGGKKVGLILCDSGGSADTARTAADHIIAAGAQAIVGPTFSEEVISVAESAVAESVFVISPTATNKSITGLNDQGPRVADDLQRHPSGGGARRSDRRAGSRSRQGGLVRQERSVRQRDPRGHHRPAGGATPRRRPGHPQSTRTRRSSRATKDLLSEYGARIGTAIQAQPDTIVVIGTTEARELILFYLDNWADMEPLPTLPRFIVTHGGVAVMEDIVNAVSESFRPTLMQNVLGVAPIIQDENNFDAYNIRYKIRFNDEEALTISSLSYDAAMVALLGMAGAGGDASGADIAAQMPRLADPAGTGISFGGAGVKFISDAVGVLESGANVDLQGVSGALDFNLETGEVRTNLINWGLLPRCEQPGGTNADAVPGVRARSAAGGGRVLGSARRGLSSVQSSSSSPSGGSRSRRYGLIIARNS